MDFIKNSLRELKHVVWPTKDETRKYFLTVLVVLILFGVYLFATGTIFKELLFAVKDVVTPNSNSALVKPTVTPEVNTTTVTSETENTEAKTPETETLETETLETETSEVAE